MTELEEAPRVVAECPWCWVTAEVELVDRDDVDEARCANCERWFTVERDRPLPQPAAMVRVGGPCPACDGSGLHGGGVTADPCWACGGSGTAWKLVTADEEVPL